MALIAAAQLLVCQGEEQSDVSTQLFRLVQPQRLNQHHVSEVLRNQKAAGLPLA